MAWPDGIVLGVIGRRADDHTLAWAFGLARRWSTDLTVVMGYRPPVGMFPHIVTEKERTEHRRSVRRRLARRVAGAVDPGLLRGAATRLTLVPDARLDRALTMKCLEADLLLFSLAPTSIPLLAQRQESRARRIAESVRVPASLGPGRPVGATVVT